MCSPKRFDIASFIILLSSIVYLYTISASHSKGTIHHLMVFFR